jgi:hypothetical protein
MAEEDLRPFWEAGVAFDVKIGLAQQLVGTLAKTHS